MKTNQKYLILSLATVLTVTGASIGALSFAQTVTPLACSTASSSVAVNQAVVVTATGGNGTYAWSGTDLAITNAGGTQFAVSYPNAGTYPITVASAGETATCNVNVEGTPSTGSLECFPAVQNVTLGETAAVSATGGDGTYTWSSPDLSIADPNGTGFSASYASTGLQTLTVTSAGLVTTCEVNVLANNTIVIPITPSLPNTGGGYGK
jgi:hypothetical protein